MNKTKLFSTVYVFIAGQTMLVYAAINLPIIDTRRLDLILDSSLQIGTSFILIATGIGLLVNSTWCLKMFRASMAVLVLTLSQVPCYFLERNLCILCMTFISIIMLSLILLAYTYIDPEFFIGDVFQ